MPRRKIKLIVYEDMAPKTARFCQNCSNHAHRSLTLKVLLHQGLMKGGKIDITRLHDSKEAEKKPPQEIHLHIGNNTRDNIIYAAWTQMPYRNKSTVFICVLENMFENRGAEKLEVYDMANLNTKEITAVPANYSNDEYQDDLFAEDDEEFKMMVEQSNETPEPENYNPSTPEVKRKLNQSMLTPTTLNE